MAAEETARTEPLLRPDQSLPRPILQSVDELEPRPGGVDGADLDVDQTGLKVLDDLEESLCEEGPDTPAQKEGWQLLDELQANLWEKNPAAREAEVVSIDRRRRPPADPSTDAEDRPSDPGEAPNTRPAAA